MTVIADRIQEMYLFVETLLPIFMNTDESVRIIGSQRIEVVHLGLGFMNPSGVLLRGDSGTYIA